MQATYCPDCGKPLAFIPLTQCFQSVIHAEDLSKVSVRKWHASSSRRFRTVYAKGAKGVALHRAILDPQPEELVDHINDNGLDNRACNLRIITHRDNVRRKRAYKDKSLPRGVHYRMGKYDANIGTNGEYFKLGRYLDTESAGRVYDCAARILYGEFARLNFPDGKSVRIACSWPKYRKGRVFICE